MTKWTQHTIHQWGIETFGFVALDTLGVSIRMAKESHELSVLLMTEDDAQEVAKESADVSIVLMQVANCLSFDLEAAFDSDSWNSTYMEAWDSCDTDVDCGAALGKYSIELISALKNAEFDHARHVIISIVAILDMVEEMYEFDLQTEINNKMEINSLRSWAKAADGSYQHE